MIESRLDHVARFKLIGGASVVIGERAVTVSFLDGWAGMDLKTVEGQPSQGSNPYLSAFIFNRWVCERRRSGRLPAAKR